jgi:hypothetical protein
MQRHFSYGVLPQTSLQQQRFTKSAFSLSSLNIEKEVEAARILA